MKREEIQIGYKEKAFHTKGSEALEQSAHSGGGCLIAGDIHGQARWSSGQPDLELDLVAGHSTCGRGV